MSMTEPAKIDRFEILEELGSGGNGTVYRVFDLEAERVFALKALKTVNDNTLSRFKREFFSLKKMKNPGIVKVFEGFFDHDPPFFSMEWVKGKTLSRLLEDLKHNPLIFSGRDREEFALRLGLQVCDTLAHIHQFGAVHRDLKPDNLLVTIDRETTLSDFRIKILDFGLLEPVMEQPRAEEKEQIFGSVHYLSPEQAQGGKSDPRSDLYSLGVILYRVVSLTLPFRAKDPMSYLYKTVMEAATPIEDHVPDCSSGFRNLMVELLAKRPADRLPSAEALKFRLQRLLAGETAVCSQETHMLGFGAPLLPAPLIGRESVLALMQEQWSQCGPNLRQTTILTGEPGMDRSKVIREWRARVKFRHSFVLHARFFPGNVPAQGPIGMLLDSLLEGLSEREIQMLFEGIHPYLAGISQALDQYFPTSGPIGFKHFTQEQKWAAYSEQLFILVQRLEQHRRVVFILEDLQHGQIRFFRIFEPLWVRMNRLNLLLVVSITARPDNNEALAFKQRLLAEPRATELLLTALKSGEVVKLVQGMLPMERKLPLSDRLVQLLMERAGGNPFYTIELFSRLYEDGQVVVVDNCLEVVAAEDAPQSIDQALLKKLERLPEDARLILKAASSFGIALEFKWLLFSLDWPEERFLNGLMFLLNQGFLIEEEEPVHRLCFGSTALQELLFSQYEMHDLSSFHQKAARAIESSFEGNRTWVLEQIAYHYARGTNYVRAVKYAYLAGNSALEARETEKAVACYKLGLEMLQKTPNQQTGNLINLKLADVFLGDQQLETALSYFEKSLALDTLSPLEKLRSLRGRMLCYQRMNRFEEALENAREMVELSAARSPRIHGETLLARGRLAWLAHGDADALLADVTAGRRVFPESCDWATKQTYAQILGNRVLEARRMLQTLARVSDRPKLPVLMQLVAIEYFMGRFSSAQELLIAAQDDGRALNRQANPDLLIFHALWTYKIQSTIAPDHSSLEYLAIARRYVAHFGLQPLGPLITLVQLEHLVISGQFTDAWQLVLRLDRDPKALPADYHGFRLFICLAMRAFWEAKKEPFPEWLRAFSQIKPEPGTSFLIRTHWVLAKAAQVSWASPADAGPILTLLDQTGALLVAMKLKYYYRFILVKQIQLLKHLGKTERIQQLERLRHRIDWSLEITMTEF